MLPCLAGTGNIAALLKKYLGARGLLSASRNV